MNCKIILLALVTVCCANSALAEIDGGLWSTIKIVGKLCWPGNHEDPAAKEFFGCYDQAPGKEQFVKCQTEKLGAPMDNKESISKACRAIWKMGGYAKCVKEELTDAGIDPEDAIKQVNVCQAKVLDVKNV